eukprot:jgi/Botrbrau1/6714/Bobra.0324s0005.1
MREARGVLLPGPFPARKGQWQMLFPLNSFPISMRVHFPQGVNTAYSFAGQPIFTPTRPSRDPLHMTAHVVQPDCEGVSRFVVAAITANLHASEALSSGSVLRFRYFKGHPLFGWDLQMTCRTWHHGLAVAVR